MVRDEKKTIEISPFDEVKILSRYEKIKEIISGSIPLPQTLDLFVSNRCNHSCLGCHSKNLFNLSPPFLKFKEFREKIDELQTVGIEAIEISGGGEPLLNPDIIQFVKYIIKKGMKVGLITNGTIFFKETAQELISNLVYIRVAFDAASPEIYKKIHLVDDYRNLLKNINNLVKTKAGCKSRVLIGLKYLISKINAHQIIEGAKQARELGVDYLQFKPLRNSRYALLDSDLKKTDELIDRAKVLSTQRFRVNSSLIRMSIKHKCYLTPLHPCIDANGNVYLCYLYQHRGRSHIIGNLYKNSFKKIWFSRAHKKAMGNILPEECNIYDCPFQKYSRLVDEAILKDKMHIDFV